MVLRVLESVDFENHTLIKDYVTYSFIIFENNNKMMIKILSFVSLSVQAINPKSTT